MDCERVLWAGRIGQGPSASNRLVRTISLNDVAVENQLKNHGVENRPQQVSFLYLHEFFMSIL